MGTAMKCIHCGEETRGTMPEEIKSIVFGKYEIKLWRWVEKDVCEDCLCRWAVETATRRVGEW